MAQLDLNSPVAMTNFLASGATFQATEGSNSDFHDGETFYFKLVPGFLFNVKMQM